MKNHSTANKEIADIIIVGDGCQVRITESLHLIQQGYLFADLE